MKIRQVPVDQVIPYPGNPRKNADAVDAVAASIQEFGFQQPIVVDADQVVIVGHTRLLAAQSLELATVPVLVADGLTPAQVRAYRLADNRTGENAEWDNDLLAAELAAIEGDIDLSLTGFTSDELVQLMDVGGHGRAGSDDIPAIRQEVTSMAGDVWIMGNHRLICGDATDGSVYDNVLNGDKIDLVVTSPPYNVGIKYSQHKDIGPREQYLNFLMQVAEKNIQRLRPGRFVAWNIGVSPKTYPAHQVVKLEECGLSFYRQIVWEKAGVPFPTFQTTMRKKAARHYKPNYKHELIILLEREADIILDETQCTLCGGDGRLPDIDANLFYMHATVQLMTNGEPQYGAEILPDSKYSSDVWKISQSQATVDLKTTGTKGGGLTKNGKMSHAIKEHPAAFPVEVPRALITFLTAQREIVIDPFGGSGSTMIAAEEMNRHARLIEIDPKYCDVIVRRWQDFTGQTATRESDGATFDSLRPESAAA